MNNKNATSKKHIYTKYETYFDDENKKISYFDEFSTSIILFFVITFTTIVYAILFTVLLYKNRIAANWGEERCKPTNIAFAGFISPSDPNNIIKSTEDNLDFCLKQNYEQVDKVLMTPFNIATDLVADSFTVVGESIQETREAIDALKNASAEVIQTIMGYILSILIPFQPIIAALEDSFGKIQGILTTILYTVLGAYYALKSLMGAILQFSIDVLVFLIIQILFYCALYYFFPIFFAMAMLAIAMFSILSALMSVFIYFLVVDMHLTTSSLPTI